MKKEDIESMIGQMLRWGTIIATSGMIIGGCVFLSRHGLEAAGTAIFSHDLTSLRSIHDLWQATLERKSTAYLQWGVLFLIFLPIMRVWLCLVSFLAAKDYVYSLISFWLLFVLLASFILSWS